MTTLKTPQDLFKAVTDTFAAFPKNPEEFKTVLEKTKNVYESEVEKTKSVIKTYSKASKGDASINEITVANKQAQSLMVTARFATLMAIPGALFMLPALKTLADEYDFELVPESVRKEFNL
jgi:hypothetical protein